MSEKWRRDLGKSAKQFVDIVWPNVTDEWFGGGDVAPVEAVSEEDFADKLDQLAGIDYWVVQSDEGMRGIASRVQSGKYGDMSTFTVRYRRKSGVDTEFQKRKQAIENDYLYPYWTIQAYVQRGKVDNAAVVRTDDLIRYIDRGELDVHYGENGTQTDGAARFYYIHWKDLDKYYDVQWLKETNDSMMLEPNDGVDKNQSTWVDF